MPGDLSGHAAAMWNVTVAHLVAAGIVSKIDGAALRTLCVAWANYLDATDNIAECGIVVKEFTADGLERIKKNPAVDVQNIAWKQIVTLLRQFGLTPASRNGIHRAGDGESDDSNLIAQVLGIGSSN